VSAPESDSAGIRQVIRALRKAGWELAYVENGEETERVKTEPEAVEIATATDLAWIHFSRGDERGWVFFVLGNDPEEVVNDYTTNLDPTVDELTRSWW